MAGRGDFVARLGGGFETAGELQVIEGRVGAVGPAVLLAQVLEEPSGEAAAERGVEHIESGKIGRVARRPGVLDDDVALHRAGAIDEMDGDAFDLRQGGQLQLRDVAGRPLAERLLQERQDDLHLHVADDRERGVVRQEVRLVKRDEILARDRLHGLGRAVVAVGMLP